MTTKSQRPLTPEQRQKIYETIYKAMQPDDRYPSEVIADTYRGDEDAYLRVMAKWHHVSLD